MSFRSRMKRAKSRLIIALDVTERPLLERALRLIDETYEYAAAFKVNRHLTIPLSLDELSRLTSAIHDVGLPAIADCKVNDVGGTNRVMAELLIEAGFDALTVSPVIGWEGGLKPVYELARGAGVGVLELVYMSHPDAKRYYEALVVDVETATMKRLYELLVADALRREADGLIVAATRPDVVSRVKVMSGERAPIYSPGIGPQGGTVEEVLRAGADFIIVGRSIVYSERPREEASKLYRLVQAIVG